MSRNIFMITILLIIGLIPCHSCFGDRAPIKNPGGLCQTLVEQLEQRYGYSVQIKDCVTKRMMRNAVRISLPSKRQRYVIDIRKFILKRSANNAMELITYGPITTADTYITTTNEIGQKSTYKVKNQNCGAPDLSFTRSKCLVTIFEVCDSNPSYYADTKYFTYTMEIMKDIGAIIDDYLKRQK